jgi:hypothetical protein
LSSATHEASAEPTPADPQVTDRGARIGRFVVTAAVRIAKHTMVLQARDPDGSFVAVKLANTMIGGELVDREIDLLRVLGTRPCPGARSVADGTQAGRRYVATRWIPGTDARVAAAELRQGGRPVRALELGARIARAYADLHAAGVLHGQVHPRHVLVDRDGAVGLLDLSVAATASDVPAPARLAARFNTLSPPEQAASLLDGENLEITAASEQYSVAALIHLLITGRLHAQLRLDRRSLAADILASPTLPFSELGSPSWPELEAVLDRALAKDPRRRYPSVDDLHRSLDALCNDAAAPAPPAPTSVRTGRAPLAGLLDDFRREAAAEPAIGRLPAPTCSINYGAAGVAFALTRLGKLTGDDDALQLADRWLSAAERDRGRPDAFDDGDELTPRTVGIISPFHNVSGLAAVRALHSDATGDRARQAAALDAFRVATQAPCANLDLTLGRSSVLLVAALLYDRSPSDWPSAQRLADHGDALSAGVLADLDATTLPYHGIAHGSAGVAYAALMWARARHREPDPAVADILDVLAAAAEPHQRGARWPLTPTDEPPAARYWPGWCHGNAGYVFLWNLARTTYGEARFAELADRAAWLIDAPAGVSSLCCGSAGQIYAALNHARASNDPAWHARALALADRSATEAGLASDSKTPLSLYKGHVGLALLALELERPDRAAMPLFEFEPAA